MFEGRNIYCLGFKFAICEYLVMTVDAKVNFFSLQRAELEGRVQTLEDEEDPEIARAIEMSLKEQEDREVGFHGNVECCCL